jgi:hypothetical protein
VRYSIVSGVFFVYCEKMEKKVFRVLMRHCFLGEKNTVEAKAWLDKHYSEHKNQPLRSGLLNLNEAK